MFSSKGKTSYTFAHAFFFGMYVSRAEKNSTEKKGYTIEKKYCHRNSGKTVYTGSLLSLLSWIF